MISQEINFVEYSHYTFTSISEIVTMQCKMNRGMNMRKFVIYLSLFFVMNLVACTAEDEYWPTEEWKVSTPEEQGMDSETLVNMFEHIEQEKNGNLHGLVVVRNGYIVAEHYPSALYDQETNHNVYSVTKSLLSGVVGIAIDEGIINLDDRVLDYFPDLELKNNSKEKEDITIEQFLTMTSGIEWDEWENASSVFTNWNMSDNQLKYYLDQPIVPDQVGKFNYDTGSAHVVGTIIENEVGMNLQDYAADKIFNKIGMKSLEWDEANEGSTMGGTNSEMTPRDMARFGYLYLHNGNWDGEQIIPKKWVDASLTKHNETGLDNYYGYYFWLWAEDDIEYYLAMGYDNQFIVIVPDYDLIAVQTSDRFDFYTLLDYIIASIKSDEPIDENKEAYENLKRLMRE